MEPAQPEPAESDLPDKPPVPQVEEDNSEPGEEPVDEAEYQDPDVAAADPETDNAEADPVE
jgi:hypothetical protein